MTDTMMVQNDVVSDDIENIPVNNLNAHSSGEEIDLTLASPKEFRSSISSSASNISPR